MVTRRMSEACWVTVATSRAALGYRPPSWEKTRPDVAARNNQKRFL
jgi:hypothetical protein